MMVSVKDIKIIIIKKMVQWRKWSASHTENIISGMPAHLRGDKITKRALKEMIKYGWLIPTVKTGEIHYSLNPKKADEILKFYEKHCNG